MLKVEEPIVEWFNLRLVIRYQIFCLGILLQYTHDITRSNMGHHLTHGNVYNDPDLNSTLDYSLMFVAAIDCILYILHILMTLL